MKKHVGSLLFLLLLMLLTAAVIVKSNDMGAVLAALKGIDKGWMCVCVMTALLFVAAEGSIIWYLFCSLSINVSIFKCMKWSFIGFFFSGITPSSTGGQPAQIYFMKKSGIRIADSTPVLMITAVLYKFVIVLIGVALLVVRRSQLELYFDRYIWLFYLGLLLNLALVVLLVFIMIRPALSQKIVMGIENILIKLRLLKESRKRREDLRRAVDQYQTVVDFFKRNKIKMVVAAAMTLGQRLGICCLTWFIYRGLGLEGADAAMIIFLQAAIYIAVDMLPLPGSAGISELVYAVVFTKIFTKNLLTASLFVSRGISFYLVLLLSAGIYVGVHIKYAALESR